MRGSVVRRGRHSWRIKFDLDRAGGARETKYVTVKGTRKQAESELARLLTAADGGTLVEPSKQTVAEFVRERVEAWEAAGDISARTAQRYRQLVENQIVPHIGAKAVQKLKPLDVEGWHTTLRNDGRLRGEGGVAARTIGHAHRVLGKALRDAARNGMVARNVVSEQSAPQSRRRRNGDRARLARPCGHVAWLAARHCGDGGAVYGYAIERGVGAALEPRRS
jgi:hypothetical protein